MSDLLKRIAGSLAVILLSVTGIWAQSDRKLTLTEAVNLAMEKNPGYQAAKSDLEKSDQQIREAYGLAMPSIDGSVQYTRNLKKPVFFLPDFNNPSSGKVTPIEIGSNNSYLASLNVTQALYSKTVGTALEVAEVYRDYSDQAVLATRQQTIMEVKKAYYGVLLSKRMVDVMQKVYSLTEENYKNVTAMYQNGLASEFDQLRMSVQLANVKPSVIQSENTLKLATLNLKNILGINETPVPTEDFEFRLLPEDQIRQGKARFEVQNPTLKQLSFQKTLLEKNVEINESNHWPSLYGFGSWQYQSQSENFKFNEYDWVESAFVGLTLSVPIFNGWQTSAKVEQAQIEVRKIDFQLVDLKRNLLLALESAELKLNESKERVEAQQSAITQAEKALSIAEIRFKSGVGMQLEVLDAQVALSQTLTNHAQAVYDYMVARAEWEQLTGTEN